MIKFLALTLGWWIYYPHSFIVALVLRIRGIKVGPGFYIQGLPYLKIRGKAKNIRIGKNVKIFGNIDIRNRENGRIHIGDNVSFDNDCRIVAAREALVEVCDSADIGAYCILNCGADVTIGSNTMIASFCAIQSSSHGTKKGHLIRYQPHEHSAIRIGQDVWLGTKVTILPHLTIGDGAIVGANSVVTKSLPENSISIGAPAKPISYRQP